MMTAILRPMPHGTIWSALLGIQWQWADLAGAAHMTLPELYAVADGADPDPEKLDRLRRIFEAAGVMFDKNWGWSVRRSQPAASP
jgi:hypothetical protein